MPVPIVGGGYVSGLVRSAFMTTLFKGLTSWGMGWVGPMAAKALVFLGITIVVQEFVMAPLIAQMVASMSGAPAAFVQVLGYVGADVAMSMILSAYVIRAAGKLMFSGGS